MDIANFIRRVQTEGLRARPNFWDAYAQGYLACLQGRPVPQNMRPGGLHALHATAFDFIHGHDDAMNGVDPWEGK